MPRGTETPSTFEQLSSHPAVRGFLQAHGLLGNDHLNPVDAERLSGEYANHEEAVAGGAEHDRGTYKQLFKGLGKLTGVPSTPRTRALAETASGALAGVSPYALHLFPKTWNELHGSRGSVASLAGDIQDTDPSADPRVSAQTAGTVFKKLHNPFQSRGAAGLSTTHLGPLYQDLYHRGLLGAKGGPNTDNTVKELEGRAGALRAMQDLRTSEQAAPPPMLADTILKSAVSTNLIARTLQNTRDAGTLTAPRMQRFKGTLTKWLPGATERNIGERQLATNALGRAGPGVFEPPTAAATDLAQRAGTSTDGSMTQKSLNQVSDVFRRPPPVTVARVADPNAAVAALNEAKILSTDEAGVLGHEIGHLAANRNNRRLWNRAYTPPQQSLLGRLFGRAKAPLLSAGPDREALRINLAKERFANAGLRRAAGVENGAALGRALGTAPMTPEAVKRFTTAQLEDYKLNELQAALDFQRHAEGLRLPVPDSAKKEFSHVTRKIMKNLPQARTVKASRALLRGPLGMGLGVAALGTAGYLGGQAARGYLDRRRTDQSIASAANPPAQMPSPFDSKGNWTGFKNLGATAREKLFQTKDYVNHPGFWEEPPRPSTLFRMMSEPESAAEGRALARTPQ